MEWYYGHAWGQSKDEENEDLKSLYSKSLHVCDLVLVFLTDRRHV